MDLNKKELGKLFDVLFKAAVNAPADTELAELMMKALEELRKK